ERDVDHEPGAFRRAVVDEREGAEHLLVAQRVRDEIHGPPLVRGGGRKRGHAGAAHALPPPPDVKARRAIYALDALAIHVSALALQEPVRPESPHRGFWIRERLGPYVERGVIAGPHIALRRACERGEATRTAFRQLRGVHRVADCPPPQRRGHHSFPGR